MKNALALDVEDYFQLSAFANQVEPKDWDSYVGRLIANTGKILEMLAQHNRLATFFVFCWVTESQPEMPQPARARFRDALGLRSLELELRNLLRGSKSCPLGLPIEQNANSKQHRRVRRACSPAQ